MRSQQARPQLDLGRKISHMVPGSVACALFVILVAANGPVARGQVAPAPPAPASSAPANPSPAAQAPDAAATLPAFDVVSIKPHEQNDRMIRMMMPPDGISVTGITLHMVLREALGVSDDRLQGEPGWVSAARYDIEAKVDPADVPQLAKVGGTDRWAMMLPVLVDRFGLKYHHETRNQTVYVLVVAKGGPKLQPSKSAGDASHTMPGRNQMSISGTDMVMNMHSATSGAIAHMISQQIGSTILDKTGLTGTYDYTLEFAPDENARGGMMMGPGGPPGGGGAPPAASGPSIFTALQEQLGLKLESQKLPVDVIVIDHIQQPSPN